MRVLPCIAIVVGEHSSDMGIFIGVSLGRKYRHNAHDSQEADHHSSQHHKTAFDMDYTSNYHVQAGYAALYALLDKLDLTYSTYLWDPRYKGLDDYIWESLALLVGCMLWRFHG